MPNNPFKNKALQRSSLSVPMQQRPLLKAACHAHVENLVETSTGINAALVVTSDGFEIDTVSKRELSSERMAAMTSSYFALSEAILTELHYAITKSLIIESENGLVVMIAVGDAKKNFYLCVIADTNAMLGQVLWAARQCCEKIRVGIDKYTTPPTY